MKPNQKQTPKYWVVHDKKTDDVFIETAHKTMTVAIDIFLSDCAYGYSGKVMADEDLQHWFDEQDNLECILIEINRVT